MNVPGIHEQAGRNAVVQRHAREARVVHAFAATWAKVQEGPPTGVDVREAVQPLPGVVQPFLLPITSRTPPMTMAPIPAHMGTLTCSFSLTLSSSGPTFTAVVSLV